MKTRLLYIYIYSDRDGDETRLHIYLHDTEVKFVNAVTAGGSVKLFASGVNFSRNNAINKRNESKK